MSKAPPGHRAFHLVLPDDVYDGYDALATDLSIPLTAALNAALATALRNGSAARAAAAVETRKRRPRRPGEVLEWECLVERPQPLPSVWHHGNWLLERSGKSRTDRWFLSGPGLEHPMPLSRSRQEAVVEADQIILRLKREGHE